MRRRRDELAIPYAHKLILWADTSNSYQAAGDTSVVRDFISGRELTINGATWTKNDNGFWVLLGDGINDGLSLTDNALNPGTDDFIAAAWVKLESTAAAATLHRFIGKGTPGSGGEGWTILASKSLEDAIYYGYRDADGNDYAEYSPNLGSSLFNDTFYLWTMIAVRGDALYIYRDTTEIGTRATPNNASVAPVTDFEAMFVNSSWYLDGELGLFAFWKFGSGGLSGFDRDSFVTNLYEATRGRYGV